jgi:sugar lactone lactonase YvrE
MSRTRSPLSGVLAVAVALAPIAAQAASPAAQETPFQELELLWEAGGPPPDDPGTMAMAIHPVTGDLWVAVAHDDQYWILSPEGEYLETWGETGSGPGQFRFEYPAQELPWATGAIAFLPDGSFFVGDTGNFRIQRFDADRQQIGEWGSFGKGDGEFSMLLALGTDGGSVFAGDCDRWDIQVFDLEGAYERTIGADHGFCEFAVGPDGVLRANNTENPLGVAMRVASLDPDGTELAQVDLDGFPGLPWVQAVGPDGTLYVSLYDLDADEHVGIVEVAPDGKVVRAFAGGGDRLLVSPEGDALYVARGATPDMERWSTIRKYALPAD